MFIIWGKKQVRRRLGYVADFCPMCRRLQTFKVKRVGIAGHIYYLSLGEGELAGHTRTCAGCDTDLNANPEIYKQLHPQKLPLEELATLTFPDWERAYAERLALERELASAPARISPQDRHALIREPFLLLGPKVEERFSASHLDWPTLGAVAGLLVLLAIAGAVAEKFPAAADFAWAAAWIAGLGAIGWQVYLIRHRFFRGRIFPALVPALGPLKPTAAELEAVLKEMKARGEKIGRKLPLKSLLAQLESGAQPLDLGTVRAT